MIGIGTSIQNFFGAILPVVLGKINNSRSEEDYQKSLYIFSYLGLIILAFAVVITLEDKRTGRILDLPENDPRVQK